MLELSKRRRNEHATGVRSTYFELDELVTRVLCDTSPARAADAAYLFGETADNESSVLAAALLAWRLGG